MRSTIIISSVNDKLTGKDQLVLSHHARQRMSERAIDLEQANQVVQYGRIVHSRHARFYVLGKRQTQNLAKQGIHISAAANIQVLVDEKNNVVLTVYKNKDFRQIRPTTRRQKHLH